ncbi:MAG: phospholipid carrier-dependent glycosyltransferase [Candidatus Levybacteria bacterium]|nr:phospholipid carrier-dependent glycosyltransferase [Candidatus Levybacteria bacterium]
MAGVDLSGYGFPKAIFKTETEGNTSIVPIMLLSPINYFLPLSQETVRISYVIINLLTGLFIYLFVFELFKKKEIALLSALLFLISPWSFYLSRYATESPFALLFFIAGIYSILKFNGRKLVIPVIFLALGFFSYHGAKIILIPLVFLTLFYKFDFQLKRLRQKGSLIFLGSIFLIFLVFILGSYFSGSILENRKNEIFFLNQEFINESTFEQLRQTIPSNFSLIFLNKTTVAANIFVQKYLTAFSTTVLSLYGDTRIIYSFSYHGLIYYSDLLFIFIGIFYLFKNNKKEFYLLISLLLISPLPAAFNNVGDSYIHRAFLMLPVLVIFSSFGVWQIFLFIKNKTNLAISATLITTIIFLSFANFLYFYFYRYPVTSGEFFALEERLLSKFISESEKFDNKKIIIASSSPRNSYLQYIFYSNNDKNVGFQIENSSKFNKGEYKINGNNFLYDCFTNYDEKTTYVIRYDKECFRDKTFPVYALKNPKDGGIFFQIMNSSLCNGIELKGWPPKKSSDFSIEKMDRKKFCKTWVNTY